MTENIEKNVWLYYIMDHWGVTDPDILKAMYWEYEDINRNKNTDQRWARDNHAIKMLIKDKKMMSLDDWGRKYDGVCPDDPVCLKQHWVEMHLATAGDYRSGYDNFRRVFKAIHKNKHDRDDNIYKKNYFTYIHYNGVQYNSGATKGEKVDFRDINPSSFSIIKTDNTRPGGGITPAEILLQIQAGLFKDSSQLLRDLQGEANLIKDKVLKAKEIEAEAKARPRDTSEPMDVDGGGKRKKTKSTRKRKPTRKRKRKSTRKRKRKSTRKR